MQSISQQNKIVAQHLRGNHVRTSSGLNGSTVVNVTYNNLSSQNINVLSSQKSNTSLQFALGGTGGT